jgi:hypothetical protein
MVIKDSPLDFPLHPLLPFMVTMANSDAQRLQHMAIRGFMVTMATTGIAIGDFRFTLLLPLPL